MSQLHPILYLPIEFQSREFDAKVLLALTLAERGYAVVIGQQWMLAKNYESLPAGTVLFKSFNKIHHWAMEAARRGGHYLAALEEELLAQSEEKGVAFSCADGIFKLVDLILAHGEFEHNVMRRLNDGGARIEISGNGRVDLLKQEYRDLFRTRIDSIRNEHGDFVLVNTNFGIHNSVWKGADKVTEIGIKGGVIKPDDPQSMKDWQEYIDYEDANQKEVDSAIMDLCRRRPEQKIIVRPHPNEDLKTWEDKFANTKNVAIIRQGSHMPWTMAARVLLHTSCTTGFEAYVAETPAVSLVPFKSWITSSLLSNKVNPIFPDAMSVVDALEKILDGEAAPSPASAQHAPEYYVWNCKQNNAIARISDLLTEKLPKEGRIELPAMGAFALNQKIREKFNVSLEECRAIAANIKAAARIESRIDIEPLQDSVFLFVKKDLASRVKTSPPLLNAEQTLAEMSAALQTRNFAKVLQVFKANIGEAQESSPCWFIAGAALIELGRPADALPHFEKAASTFGGEPNFQLLFMLAVTHGQLGQFPEAVAYAKQAMKESPNDPKAKELHKSLSAQLRKK